GKILVPEGSEGVKVNAPIAVLLGEGEKAGEVDISAAMKNIGEAVKAEAPKKPEPPKPEAIPPQKGEGRTQGPGRGPTPSGSAAPNRLPLAGGERRIFAS